MSKINAASARALFAMCFGRSAGHMAMVPNSAAVLVLAREVGVTIPDDGLDCDEVQHAVTFLRDWADALEAGR